MRLFRFLAIIVAFGLFTSFVWYNMDHIFPETAPLQHSHVSDGDIISLSGPEVIQVSVYTEQGTKPTTISTENCQVLGTTKAGAKDGYYDLMITLSPGSYKISGDDAYLSIKNDGQVTNPAADTRAKDTRWRLTKIYFFFGMFYGLILAWAVDRWTRPETNTEE